MKFSLLIIIITGIFILAGSDKISTGNEYSNLEIYYTNEVIEVLTGNENIELAINVIRTAEKYNIRKGWLIALIIHESGFNIYATGGTGDHGLMQITKWALHEYNIYHGTLYEIKDLYNSSINLNIGCWFLQQKLRETNNRYNIALAKYNAGKYYKNLGLQYYNKVREARKRFCKI